MIRLLFFLVLISALVGLVYWFFLDSGNIIITALGYELETSVTLAILSFIILLLAFHFFFRLIYGVISLPAILIAIIRDNQARNYTEKLYQFLEAIYSNNFESIQKISVQLKKSSLPAKVRHLVSLLAVKMIGRNSIDELLELTKSHDSKLYALVELAEEALAKGDFAVANSYAEAAWKCDKNYNTARLFIRVYAVSSDWQKLVDFVDSLKLRYIMGGRRKDLTLGMARFMLAADAYNAGDLDSAASNIAESQSLMGGLLPLEQLSIKIKIRQKKIRAAVAEIKSAWKLNANHHLTAMVMMLKGKLSDSDFFKLADELRQIRPDNYESHILMAKAALNFDQFDVAAREIGEALGDGHKVKACQLMAEFCLRTHGNNTEALSWLHYALQAKSDEVEQICMFNLDSLDLEKSASARTLYVNIQA